MKHPEKVFEPIFPAYCEAAIVLKPGEETFDFPAAAATPERTAILRAIPSIASVRSDHFHSGVGQFPI